MDKLSFIKDIEGSQRNWGESEMLPCQEKGECVNCGLCCIGFTNEVPVQPLEMVGQRLLSTKKASLQVCPWLEMAENGGTKCGCHEYKHDPSLSACVSWTGNAVSYATNTKELDRLNDVFWKNVLRSNDPADFLMANALIKKGIIFKKVKWLIDMGYVEMTRCVFMGLKVFTRYDRKTEDLFDFIELKEQLRNLKFRNPDLFFKFIDNLECALNELDVEFKEYFVRRYLDGLLPFPSDRP